jgi:hypothetical protein
MLERYFLVFIIVYMWFWAVHTNVVIDLEQISSCFVVCYTSGIAGCEKQLFFTRPSTFSFSAKFTFTVANLNVVL